MFGLLYEMHARKTIKIERLVTPHDILQILLSAFYRGAKDDTHNDAGGVSSDIQHVVLGFAEHVEKELLHLLFLAPFIIMERWCGFSMIYVLR